MLTDVLVSLMPADTDRPPRQLVVRNTVIHGDLDLHGLTVRSHLSLYNCTVDGIINLLDAEIPGLMMDTGSVQWLDGANAVVASELWLKNVTFRAGLDLTDARVGGSVHLEGSTFKAETRPVREDSLPGGCPLRLNRVTIGGSLNAARITCEGMVDLADARVEAGVELEGADIKAPPVGTHSGPVTAVNAPGLRVGGSVTADRLRLRTQRVIVMTDSAARSKDSGTTIRRVVPRPERALEPTPAEADGGGAGAKSAAADPPVADRRFTVVGRLYFANARVGGDLDLTGAMLEMPDDRGGGAAGLRPSADPVGPTLDAQRDFNAVLVLDRCDVRGNVELDDGFRARGLIRMTNARIAGDLRLNGSEISGQNHTGEQRVYSLVADGVEILGQVDASSARITGEVRLRDARVGHNLFFRKAELHAPNGNALNVERAEIGGTVDCTAVRARGSLRMLDTVCGPVVLNGAVLTDPCTADNSSPFDAAGLFDPVLNLIGAQVTGFIQAGIDEGEGNGGSSGPESAEAVKEVLVRPFTAEGAVSLRQARVTRSVQFGRAVLSAVGTVALQASALTAADLDLDEARITGGLVFTNAVISGSVTLTGTMLDVPADHTCELAQAPVPERWWRRLWPRKPQADERPSPRPPSLDGSSASIGGDLVMTEMHAAHPVRLRRATVFRRVDIRKASFCDDAYALDLAGLHSPDIQLTPAAVRGRVDLSNIITILWMDNDTLWDGHEVDVWGLDFAILIDGNGGQEVRHQLTRQLKRLDAAHILLPQEYGDTKSPKDQIQPPYQQLARHYRERGLDREARRVLNRMSRREWRTRHEDEKNLFLKAGIWLARWSYDLTLGFGYRLTRAFGVLLGVWLLGGVLFAGYAKHIHAVPTAAPSGAPAATNDACALPDDADPVPSQPGYCGTYNPYLYSLDVLLPVIDLGQASSWHFRSAVPQAVDAGLQVIGWGLASAVALSALSLVGGSGGSGEPAQPRWSSK